MVQQEGVRPLDFLPGGQSAGPVLCEYRAGNIGVGNIGSKVCVLALRYL